MGYAKNIGHNLVTQILKIIFGMLTGIIVARALGPAGQGYAAYILLVFNLLGTFGHLGIVSAAPYFQKKSDFARKDVFSTNLNTVALIVLGLTFGVLISYLCLGALADYSAIYIVLGIILMGVTLFVEHYQNWLIADERIIENNRAGLVSFFIKSGAIVLLWILGLLTPFSFLLVNAISLTIWLIQLLFKVRESYAPIISGKLLKAEYLYGSVAWTASLFAFLHYRLDQFMIKAYLGVKELGVYTIAVTIAELLFLLPMAIHSALSGRLYNADDEAHSRHVVTKTFRLSMLICFLLCFVGVAGSFLIPFVYGRAYQGGTAIMLILLPGILFASAPKLLSPWFFASGRPKIHLLATTISLGMNLILNLIFIPIWGANGAAFASTISYFFYGAYYLVAMKYVDGFSLRELLLPHRDDLEMLKGLLQR
ncbi:MAG: oligosaccharide flippase family protein [Candidatus Cloacimonetes bacterium]|nr:oligosaccharide flippase family protein [Candidatus Cloacimonadota bacterium]